MVDAFLWGNGICGSESLIVLCSIFSVKFSIKSKKAHNHGLLLTTMAQEQSLKIKMHFKWICAIYGFVMRFFHILLIANNAPNRAEYGINVITKL